MKFVKQSFEIIPQEEGIDGLYKHIELAGRTCYKSQDKITENSAKEFVDRLIKNEHFAMLEHGTVYLYIPWNGCNEDTNYKYFYNKYSARIANKKGICITTNYRTLIENNWIDDLKYLCNPTENHSKRVTVKLITDQGILREFTRHKNFCVA